MKSNVLDVLTPRELEVLALIAEGKSLAEIAQILNRSHKTIESHRLALGRKLQASNRVALARIAIAAGLVTVPDSEAAREDAGTHPSAGAPQEGAGGLKEEGDALIRRAVADVAGPTLLQRFCNAASRLPGISIAAICTPEPDRPEGPDLYCRQVLAAAVQGEVGDVMRYHAAGTPCETILEEGRCCYSAGVARAYPADTLLSSMSIESYIGGQLLDETGKMAGAFALMGPRPVEDVEPYWEVVQPYLTRLAAELILCNEMDAMRRRCEELEAQLGRESSTSS